MRGTKGMLTVMESFEKTMKSDYTPYVGAEVKRLDPNGNPVEGWPKDFFYTHAEVNKLFKLFMSGYMAGRLEYMN
jgi:hypothetical protein